jgi:hypothetical protein
LGAGGEGVGHAWLRNACGVGCARGFRAQGHGRGAVKPVDYAG